MKTIAAELAYFLRGQARQNIRILVLYCAFLVLLIVAYATIFKALMYHVEGREFSFIAGVYWTITAMTTLGFGDITFDSEPGFIFSNVVTVSGVVFLLIILPFGLISLFVAPWIEHRLRYKPTRELPPETAGHVLLFGLDSMTRTFIRKLEQRQIPFVIVTADHAEAIRLEEEGLRVLYGTPTDAKLLADARVPAARYIVANLSAPENVNLCLTVRTLGETPIAALVEEPEHADLLQLAGATHPIPLKKILGRYLATRATTLGAMAHILDSFGELLIAEIPVHGTPFAGQTLAQVDVGPRTGLAVVGMWERGVFTVPSAETLLDEDALIVLAGAREQLEELERLTGENASEDLVFILGHGRIGCAAGRFLERGSVPFILFDQKENPACEEHAAVIGDATSRTLLKKAGIEQAHGLIVTTNDDNTNIFLTLASRHSNPHMRIVARANREENVDQLYAAGADFVVSKASAGANILLNVLENKESIFLTEGINVFRRPLPKALDQRSIEGGRIRQLTDCTVIALERPGTSEPIVCPPPDTVLKVGMQLILIGSPEQEERFSRVFR